MSKPQPLSVIEQNIPFYLTSRRQWVCWRYELTDDRKGWTKVLYCPQTGMKAMSNKPATWTTFAQALAVYRDPANNYDGVGIVMCAAPGADYQLIALDLDKCRNAQTGELQAWAREIVDHIPTYWEVTPSGTGLRAFGLGHLPPYGRKKGNFECYYHAHYFTVTGRTLEGALTSVELVEQQILDIHKIFWANEPPAEPPPQEMDRPRQVYEIPNEELIEKACAMKGRAGTKFRALWSGDWSGYASQSEADQALCNYLAFWAGPDRERIDELFCMSGLFREKWKRLDYKARTINRALEGRTDFFDPARPTVGPKAARGRPRKSTPATPDAPLPEEPPQADEPPPEDNGNGDDVPEPEVHATDLGNARRIVVAHGRDMRYCHPWSKWLIWEGRFWLEDDTAAAMRLAHDTQNALYQVTVRALGELDSLPPDERKVKSLELMRQLKHALAWEASSRLAASLTLAATLPGVPVLPAEMDRDHMLYNVQNGTVNLRTGALQPHDRRDLMTKIADIPYIMDAQCPMWLKFLDRIFDGNQAVITYVQRLMGYGLTGLTTEQILPFFYGTGANGKSTLVAIWLAMLGGYGMQAAPDLLMAKNNAQHPTELADLFRVRTSFTVEVNEGQLIAEALTKQLTGGDKMRARKCYQDSFEFESTSKIVLVANHKPRIRGTDHAMWRRIKMVPFAVTIPAEERDKDLVDKLRAELPGILAWTVQGCKDWQAQGLGEPDEVRMAVSEYQADQDELGKFISECCNSHPDAKVRSAALLERFISWSGNRFMTPRNFSEKMKEKGYESVRTNYGTMWKGLALPAEEDDGA